MRIRHPTIVRPDGHEVADVDNEVILGNHDIDPLAAALHDLKSADPVVGQQCDRAVVGVRTATQLTFDWPNGLLRWVVNHAEVVDGVAEREEVFDRKIECDRHCSHHAFGSIDRFGEVTVVRLAETGSRRQLVRAVQGGSLQNFGVIRRMVDAGVERFL